MIRVYPDRGNYSMLTEIRRSNVCLADANTSLFQRCGEWSNTLAVPGQMAGGALLLLATNDISAIALPSLGGVIGIVCYSGGDLTPQQRAAGEKALSCLRTQLENLEKALKSAASNGKPLSGDTSP